jgi:hypothetical protein
VNEIVVARDIEKWMKHETGDEREQGGSIMRRRRQYGVG